MTLCKIALCDSCLKMNLEHTRSLFSGEVMIGMHFVCLSVCLSSRPSIHPSVRLSVRLSGCNILCPDETYLCIDGLPNYLVHMLSSLKRCAMNLNLKYQGHTRQSKVRGHTFLSAQLIYAFKLRCGIHPSLMNYLVTVETPSVIWATS